MVTTRIARYLLNATHDGADSALTGVPTGAKAPVFEFTLKTETLFEPVFAT